MTQATKQEVGDLLAPYASRISDICIGAWAEWMQAPYKDWRCNRTRAGFVWEEMIKRAHTAFVGDPRIHILRRNESFLFVLDGQLAFRFKKSDETGATANVPTQAQMAFVDPEQELPGVPEAMRVEIGYVLNKLETSVIDVRVVAKNCGKVAWMLSMLPEEANVIPMPSTITLVKEGEAASRRRLVRAKSVNKDVGLSDAG